MHEEVSQGGRSDLIWAQVSKRTHLATGSMTKNAELEHGG